MYDVLLCLQVYNYAREASEKKLDNEKVNGLISHINKLYGEKGCMPSHTRTTTIVSSLAHFHSIKQAVLFLSHENAWVHQRTKFRENTRLPLPSAYIYARVAIIFLRGRG